MGRHYLLPLATALLLAGVAGMVSVPDQVEAMLAAADARAVRTLGEIAVAEYRARALRLIDRDAEGTGEFAFLGDLLVAPRGGTALLSANLSPTPDAGVHHAGGFRFQVYLPGKDGSPLTAADASLVEPAFAAQAFLVLAWPEAPGRSGRRVYAVNQSLAIQEDAAEQSGPRGDGPPPPPVARLYTLNPVTGQTILPSPPASRWPPLLPDAQRRWMTARFTEYGLPLPSGLALPGR